MLHRFRRQWCDTATITKRRLSNVPVPGESLVRSCGRTSCLCPKTSPSDPVERAEPNNPSEAVGDPGSRSHQNYPRRWRRGRVRNGYRTRGQSSGCDTSSRRRVSRRRARLRQAVGHLMSCWSSATSASLIEHCALRTLATRKLYQQTLEHFMTFLSCQTKFAQSGGHADGYRSHSLQQQSIHVRGAASLGQHTDGCPHAQISPILKTRRWQATKIPQGPVRLEIAHSRSHAKIFPLHCVVINRSNTGVGGSSAHGRFPLGHVVQ